jgi:uncharacterized Zn finger protein
MARQVYGQSWWGQQWLNALSHIDNDNRLPRGRTYANKGAVTQIEIEGGGIKAKVSGSRPRPYQVSMSLPALTSTTAEQLLDVIIADPLMVARLLNGELDPSLLSTAQWLNITLFPTQWRDLHMSCNCPDWPVPCKHLAAVVYLISRSIDGDPFLVFSLRGLDLLGGLKRRGIQVTSHSQTLLPTLVDISCDNDRADGDGAVQQPDFSTIPLLTEVLPQLLSPNPVFYPFGDFRTVYHTQLKRRIKQWQKYNKSANTGQDERLVVADRPRLFVDDNYQITLSGCAVFEDWKELTSALMTLEVDKLAFLQPEIVGLYQVNLCAQHLIARGAVIPQIFRTEDGIVHMRWLPALLDQQVNQQITYLAADLPDGMIMLNDSIPMQGKAQVLMLCGLLVTRWLQMSSNIAAEDKLQQLFFGRGYA